MGIPCGYPCLSAPTDNSQGVAVGKNVAETVAPRQRKPMRRACCGINPVQLRRIVQSARTRLPHLPKGGPNRETACGIASVSRRYRHCRGGVAGLVKVAAGWRPAGGIAGIKSKRRTEAARRKQCRGDGGTGRSALRDEPQLWHRCGHRHEGRPGCRGGRLHARTAGDESLTTQAAFPRHPGLARLYLGQKGGHPAGALLHHPVLSHRREEPGGRVGRNSGSLVVSKWLIPEGRAMFPWRRVAH
jgi:hypothetical protein